MDIALFHFDLPDTHIAHTPLSKRDAARMLHVTPDALADSYIYKLPELLTHNDVLVLNNTKVIPARLYGVRDAVTIEILLHKHIAALDWRCFAKPAKRLKLGQHIVFGEQFRAEVIDKLDTGEVTLRFLCSEEAFWQHIDALGQMPLPPYIARQMSEEDKERYQTVFAENAGSVAAPTAGLHFTESLLQQLRDKGVEIYYVTLHVGGGTFLPVKVEDTKDHHMHSEFGIITEAVATSITSAKATGKRIVAVGTTSLRLLESASDEFGALHPFHQETDIFITPGYRFKMVDRLLTNFHLPKSTLFMLVSAFAGLDKMHSAYQHAIANDYRFYSYGDACFLEKSQ
jgi:S-adenosylmethionine:tRNA ribosyltransferase-isomerase